MMEITLLFISFWSNLSLNNNIFIREVMCHNRIYFILSLSFVSYYISQSTSCTEKILQ